MKLEYKILIAATSSILLLMTSENPHCKRCTSAGFTSVTQDGEFRRTASSGNVEVFEGFFDFLSWQTLRGGLVPGCDVCVLNSVTNVDLKFF